MAEAASVGFMIHGRPDFVARDDKETIIAQGSSLLIQLGILADRSMEIFVQRNGELARGDPHRRPARLVRDEITDGVRERRGLEPERRGDAGRTASDHDHVALPGRLRCREFRGFWHAVALWPPRIA